MAKTVDGMISDIIQREGGFVDDPNDKGGATQYGVSLRYAKGIGLDLDHDGDVDTDDIRLVTPEEAAKLYKEDFYEAPRINLLPEMIRPFLFDCAVNHGAPRAIMFLQTVLAEAGRVSGEWTCTVDGVVGPKTRKIAELAKEEMGRYLLDALVEERIAFYNEIVRKDPTQRKFLNGWTKRARGFL